MHISFIHLKRVLYHYTEPSDDIMLSTVFPKYANLMVKNQRFIPYILEFSLAIDQNKDQNLKPQILNFGRLKQSSLQLCFQVSKL